MVDKPKRSSVTFQLDETYIQRLDKAAVQHGSSRSQFLRKLIERILPQVEFALASRAGIEATAAMHNQASSAQDVRPNTDA